MQANKPYRTTAGTNQGEYELLNVATWSTWNVPQVGREIMQDDKQSRRIHPRLLQLLLRPTCLYLEYLVAFALSQFDAYCWLSYTLTCGAHSPLLTCLRN